MAVDLYMSRALSEGRKALPACLPNPPVGCVLVQSGKIIGLAHTQPPGGVRAAGIEVQIGLMGHEARMDLAPYLNLPSNHASG
jgi:pyrimidine deaminase RibD-like protein